MGALPVEGEFEKADVDFKYPRKMGRLLPVVLLVSITKNYLHQRVTERRNLGPFPGKNQI